MKYVIDLKKDGQLRGQLIRDSKEEAQAVVDEWSGRGCGNSADYQEKERLWYGIYNDGKLSSVVDDVTYDTMKATGLFNDGLWESMPIDDGKFYESLSEAMIAKMREYGLGV